MVIKKLRDVNRREEHDKINEWEMKRSGKQTKSEKIRREKRRKEKGLV